jgi:hypothetical protein
MLPPRRTRSSAPAPLTQDRVRGIRFPVHVGRGRADDEASLICEGQPDDASVSRSGFRPVRLATSRLTSGQSARHRVLPAKRKGEGHAQ